MNFARTHIVVDAAAVADGDLRVILEPVHWIADIHERMSVGEYEHNLRQVSAPQRYAYAIADFAHEVRNGGFSGYYYNQTAIMWRDALAGLDAVGILDAAAIAEESARRFGQAPPRGLYARQKLMDEMHLNFDDLDDAFLAVEGIERSIQKYALANVCDFLFDGFMMKPDG